MNRDGFLDLLAHFRTAETGLAFGDTEACRAGKVRFRRRFEGCDRVHTVPGQ